MFWKEFGRTVTSTAVVIVFAATIIAVSISSAFAGFGGTQTAATLTIGPSAPAGAQVTDAKWQAYEKIALLLTIGFTVGISSLAAGLAVGKVGAAAMGAAAEQPEIIGRALVFVAVAEGIAVFGLIIGIMLLLRL